MKKAIASGAAIVTLLLLSAACVPAAQPAVPGEGAEAQVPSTTAPATNAQATISPAEIAGVEAVVTSAGSEDPNVRLLVSDEANDIGDFAELWVLVSGVGFVPGDGDGKVEFIFEEPVQLDLVPLVAENAIVLWEGYLPEGAYSKVFLYVDETYGVLVGADEGESVTVQLPSNKLQVAIPMTIGDEAEGESSEYVFDVSVHRAGSSGKYILQPQLTESGEGKTYRLLEQTRERESVKKGKPEWAGKHSDDDDDDEDEDEDGRDEEDEDDEDDDEDSGRPSVDVTVVPEAIDGAIMSTITIENSSDVEVAILSVASTVYWQVRGGNWKYLEEVTDDAGYNVAAGDSLTLDYEIPCDVPEEAREVRNVAEVTIDGRDKTFSDTESLAPRGYTREIEFEGIIDTLDPLTITDDEGNTFTVIVDDETEVDGDLVAGTEVEVEGVLRPDGNVLAFQIEIEDA